MPQVESNLEVTCWRDELKRGFEHTGDGWGDIEATTLDEAALDRRFDAGWGSTTGEPFTIWTRPRGGRVSLPVGAGCGSRLSDYGVSARIRRNVVSSAGSSCRARLHTTRRSTAACVRLSAKKASRVMARVHDSIRSPDAIASRRTVRASRCMSRIQRNGILLERLEQQRVPQAAPGNQIHIAPEDGSEFLSQPHECAEVVDVGIDEVDQNIYVAPLRIEVSPCRGTNECERGDRMPSARRPNGGRMLGDGGGEWGT